MMKFTKMHGCQNDFVFVNCFNKNISVNLNKLAKNIKADAFMQIFTDGSEDTMCEWYQVSQKCISSRHVF